MWNVLIVEDHPDHRQRLVDALENNAHCITCTNGDEAIEIFKQWQDQGKWFDFILLDVTMPQKDGFEVLKTIRSLEEASNPESGQESQIIMITSFKDSLMENYNMGWDDFITKPIDPDILIERMQSLLKK